MLTRIRIRNFKQFDDIDVELGPCVLLIGPNNSGKTTVLQALALWELGVRRWLEKRSNSPSGAQRVGVAINRRDLIPIPVPHANLLWRGTRARRGKRIQGRQATENIMVEVVVDGISDGVEWSCGLEFDYANEESLYCRPLRAGSDEGATERMVVPTQAGSVRVAFLPPMSGLAADEPVLESGRINVLIGEGQTAQVLRNLCYRIYGRTETHDEWNELAGLLHRMFGVRLDPPAYISERGEVRMTYQDAHGVELTLSASGRGLQQVLLLLAHLYAHPGSVLLLDEPDAHLEVLRQREVYRALTRLSEDRGCQVIAASHSEIVLEEAADRHVVVAFVGTPHRVDDRGFQARKALRDIGYDQYQLAETKGWVLYLEGPTDLEILTVLARKLEHPALEFLEQPFFKAVETNLPQRARDHFFGLREAKADLVGVALFDRLGRQLAEEGPLVELSWRRREIENYVCQERVLMRYARGTAAGDLFALADSSRREQAMARAIRTVADSNLVLKRPEIWSKDCKASDDALEPIFDQYFKILGLPNQMRKSDYHVLASVVLTEEIDSEIVEKLDAIVEVAQRAKPRV